MPNQANALVVPDRLDIHVRLPREVTDGELSVFGHVRSLLPIFFLKPEVAYGPKMEKRRPASGR